ncbi:cation:proton antiporter [uncultured Clostridium sp.]|jgi:Kef-type K+ transport system membrane component KefB|uniref:cation:proton antiporter n=1 Tax=uncultured Clostridium sp. TaxID=59620 RepID=UPI002639244B|nr:cation:proton antiporter [uncultured Clostridium sp.]
MSHGYLLDLALILLSTKLFGLLTKKFKLPQVVGALLAGVILGPSVLGILHETNFIDQLSSLGVIVLMFAAGLETDVAELKKTGKASLAAALLGVIIPLVAGIILAMVFHEGSGSNVMLKYVFIGIILTATSVSITVETLKELGKLSTRAGNTILGAALIDDILGIIGLTVVTSMADSTVSIGIVLLKIVLFFVFAGIVGFIVRKLFIKWTAKHGKDMKRFVIMSFVLCLGLSYIAEEFFGVTDITGAFIAGMVISNTERTHFINKKFETLSYILLSPIFFASIGIKLNVDSMDMKTIIFTIVLIVVAILTKIIGGGLGVKFFGYSNREAMQVGAGMVSRGEVALIVANKGMAVGLMAPEFLVPVVIMVIATTIAAPILLKIVFKNKPGQNDPGEESIQLVKDYVEVASERIE